jgi:hypothetical protein
VCTSRAVLHTNYMTNETALSVPLELLNALAPDQPMNQDEQGGCVWCGGGPSAYGYARAIQEDHNHDCPWLRARLLLCEVSPTLTVRNCDYTDPALLRIPGFDTTQRKLRKYENSDTVLVAEKSPAQACGIIEWSVTFTRQVLVSLFYVVEDDREVATLLVSALRDYASYIGCTSLEPSPSLKSPLLVELLADTSLSNAN